MSSKSAIPVIDLFAGPGGLGEGFSALGRSDRRQQFQIRLSIEKDPIAHQTLQLRAFFRQFPPGDAPNDYYEHVKGKLSRGDLFARHEQAANAAHAEAWNAELGVVTTAEIRRRIHEELGTNDLWVLIGGPPCQAYSNVGRSRNKGVKGYKPENDPRQYLYVEYLQILADHRPAVFVMENVKGLLSATLNQQRIFDRILEDLHHPATALRREGRPVLQARGGYRIYSLEHPSMFGDCPLKDFVVHAERHGIPQARHRVILLGVRDDISGSPETLPVIEEASAWSVLGDLPRLRSGLSDGDDSPERWKEWITGALQKCWARAMKDNGHADVYEVLERTIENLRTPQKGRGGEFLECQSDLQIAPEWFLDDRLRGVCNHSTRSHMPSDLYRYLYAAAFAGTRGKSPKLTDFPLALLPEHRNALGRGDGGVDFEDRFRVQLKSRPATTITSHISKDGHYYIHPDAGQCRSLTVREAARLQTFPDNYFFSGGRTAQYHQVGNAVPPLMASEIARIVWKFLQ